MEHRNLMKPGVVEDPGGLPSSYEVKMDGPPTTLLKTDNELKKPCLDEVILRIQGGLYWLCSSLPSLFFCFFFFAFFGFSEKVSSNSAFACILVTLRDSGRTPDSFCSCMFVGGFFPQTTC